MQMPQRFLTTAVTVCAALPAPLSALEEITGFGDNPGALRMFLHRPTSGGTELPLVMALHGCTQSAGEFDDETGLTTLADETPFVLLLPQQSSDNMFNHCFRWYDTDDNRPFVGESASLREMIDFALATEPVDPSRVYVLGLSAGGGMTAVMLANYPDVFAGGAIFAGLPYGCNRAFSVFDWVWYSRNSWGVDGHAASWACGILGSVTTDRDGAEWAQFVRDAGAPTPDRWPPVSLWQGTGDETVDPDNLTELLEQWSALHGINTVADTVRMVGDATQAVFEDAGGMPRIETWTLPDF